MALLVLAPVAFGEECLSTVLAGVVLVAIVDFEVLNGATFVLEVLITSFMLANKDTVICILED